MRPVERSHLRHTFFVGKVIIYTSIFFIIATIAILLIARTEEVVIAQGTVQPLNKCEIHALDAGVLTDVRFKGGESVKAGELLAQLDDRKLTDEKVRKQGELTEADGQLTVLQKKLADEVAKKKSLITEAEAQLRLLQMKGNRLQKDPAQTDQYRFARTELEVAEKEVEAEKKEVARVDALVKENVAAPAELDRERVKLEQAEGRLKTAQEKVRILNLDLSKDTLAEAHAETALQEKRLASQKEEMKTIQSSTEAEIALQEKHLASLKEDLKTLENNIERCKIESPIAGTVVLSGKKSGEAVTPGELIFIIAQSSKARLDAQVDQSQFSKVGLGQLVRIYPTTFDYREYGEAKGRVAEIFPYAQSVGGSNKFEVRINVYETPLPLQFGSGAEAHIVVGERGLLDMLLGR